MVIVVCPHCGATEFQLWAGIDGKPAVQCLSCGETAVLDQSKLPEPPVKRPTPKLPEARK